MIRIVMLLLVSALLVMAVACGDEQDGGETPTETPGLTEPTATEPQPTEPSASPEPTSPDGVTDDAAFRLTVTIDGEPMSENHPGVGAQVDGNNCGSSLFVDGAWEISVASDGGKSGCGTPGATVIFVLLGAGDPGGTEADETGVWDNTRVNELAINFTTE